MSKRNFNEDRCMVLSDFDLRNTSPGCRMVVVPHSSWCLRLGTHQVWRCEVCGEGYKAGAAGSAVDLCHLAWVCISTAFTSPFVREQFRSACPPDCCSSCQAIVSSESAVTT